MASKIAIWCWLLAVNSSRNVIWSLNSSPHLSMSLSHERMLGFPHIWVPKVMPGRWEMETFHLNGLSLETDMSFCSILLASAVTEPAQTQKEHRLLRFHCLSMREESKNYDHFYHLCIHILNFSKIEGGFHYLHYYLLFRKLSFWVIVLVKYINLFKTIICLPFKWVSAGGRGRVTVLNQIYQRII